MAGPSSTETLRANILGRDVHLVADHASGMAPEPVPEVAPSAPAELIIDDCRGFKLFATSNSVLDPEHLTLVLYWTESKPRSLTILGTSPSCRKFLRDFIKRTSPEISVP
jgi:hypothetical protein